MNNVAIIHYWLVRMRGGEQVLKHLLNLYGNADVFTNVYDRAGVADLFSGKPRPKTTWIDSIPFSKKIYPALVGLMPLALESLDLKDYDTVISSESGPAKWVIPAPHAHHICYIHTPMRYLWDQRHEYRSKLPKFSALPFDMFTSALRVSDVISSHRVDTFVANSSFVAKRVEKYYRRDAVVIHPPVETDEFIVSESPDDYYLYAGQLVSYKNIRHAVEACLDLGRRLVVVGDGPGSSYVRKFSNHNINYLGRVDRGTLINIMSKCRALLFPGVEDFGIIPVEVLASGRPIIAVARGGIVDTVRHEITGILYDNAGVEQLKRAILSFEEWVLDFNPSDATSAAAKFSPRAFQDKWKAQFFS